MNRKNNTTQTKSSISTTNLILLSLLLILIAALVLYYDYSRGSLFEIRNFKKSSCEVLNLSSSATPSSPISDAKKARKEICKSMECSSSSGSKKKKLENCQQVFKDCWVPSWQVRPINFLISNQ